MSLHLFAWNRTYTWRIFAKIFGGIPVSVKSDKSGTLCLGYEGNRLDVSVVTMINMVSNVSTVTVTALVYYGYR